jgi:hypothetical protein
MRKEMIPNDIINRMVVSVIGRDIQFKPKREFYKRVNIGQKRFWKLMRGETSPTLEELHTVAKYLKRNLQVEIPLIQLSLYDEYNRKQQEINI